MLKTLKVNKTLCLAWAMLFFMLSLKPAYCALYRSNEWLANIEEIEAQQKKYWDLKNKLFSFLANPICCQKKYKNERYGFEVSFPRGWEIVETKPRISSNKAGNENKLQKITIIEKENIDTKGEFKIKILANPKKLTLPEWIDHYSINNASNKNLIEKKSNIELSERPAIRFSVFLVDHSEIEIITMNRGNIYSLSFTESNPNDKDLEKHRIIYNLILSTFKFMD